MPELTKTPPHPDEAVLPVMVHDDKVTVPLLMNTPPPAGEFPHPVVPVFPVIEEDDIVTVPEAT